MGPNWVLAVPPNRSLFIQDDHSRFIVGHGIFDGERTQAVITTVQDAVAAHGRPERLVALVPHARFHLTRYYGVLAPGSKDRAKLPDLPSLTETFEEESGKKNSKRRKRILWATLLKRTYMVDVFQCPNCDGRMQLISVVECTQVIFETLTAMGISPRAPPILPARNSNDLFSEAFSEFGI